MRAEPWWTSDEGAVRPQLTGVVHRGWERVAGQLENLDLAGEAGQGNGAGRVGGDACWQALDSHRGDEYLVRCGDVAQASRHVDGRTNVIVTLEQQRVSGGDAGAQREWRAHLRRTRVEIQRELDRVGLLDSDDHAAITEPLGDPHAAFGCDFADDGAECAEQPAGGVVAECRGVVGEARKIEEDERARDSHAPSLRTGGAAVGLDWRSGCTVGVMTARYVYSRWDGTQRGFELDPDTVLETMTDDLVEHGDVNAALRRLMNDGLIGRNGERVAGLRELLERLREARRERLDRFDLGGVYDGIARELNDIVDEERHAIDRSAMDARAEADRTGDPRRADVAGDAATERLLRLDLMPEDLAGRIAALQRYDFASAQAEGRFEALLDRLRSQLANQMFEQMSGSLQAMTPEALARMKDMMTALNEMLDRHQRGEDPRFDEFMGRYGEFFPDNPSTIEDLLAALARGMASMQAMVNSMTPGQRAQLQQLSEGLLGDMDLRWQMEQLAANLRSLAPTAGWDASYDFTGDTPLGMSGAVRAMAELGDLDQLDALLRGVTSPAALAEADLDKVRDLVGDDAMRSLQRLAELTRALTDAGLVDQTETGLRLTPRGVRSIGANALRELFAKLTSDQIGQHQVRRLGFGHERTPDTKPYEYGDPFLLDLQRTIRNALARRSRESPGLSGTPVGLEPDDFAIEQTEHLSRSSTVLMLDLSMSMPMEGRFVPAKKVAMALHALISSQFPRDYLGVVVFSETARVISPERIPEASWDYVYGTNMHHGLTLARQLLSRQHGTKQIIMVTDGEPTAHVEPGGDVFFHYPPVSETIEATLREVLRCTRAGIRINTFMLGATQSLKAFVERISEINRGRVFFTTPETLGDYVLVDYIEQHRQQRTYRRAG